MVPSHIPSSNKKAMSRNGRYNASSQIALLFPTVAEQVPAASEVPTKPMIKSDPLTTLAAINANQLGLRASAERWLLANSDLVVISKWTWVYMIMAVFSARGFTNIIALLLRTPV